MDQEPWQAFRPDLRGCFIDRPNRFVARVDLGGRLAEAHCPNPGRITELLFPGATVILEEAPAGRKLAYTLAAVERPRDDGGTDTIPLASVRANGAVGALVLPVLFPGARSLRAEFSLGDSRFDWLVEDAAGTRHLVEVKACSEVERGTALFPDAPSARARKHLEELAFWGDRGYVPHVVFAVVHGRPRSFGPNIHTDPEFARSLAALAPRLRLHAVGLTTAPDGATLVTAPDLPVDLTPPGPDSGHLIRVEEAGGSWNFRVEWFSSGFERAVSKAPARRSFSIRGTADRTEEYAGSLGAAAGTGDPRNQRPFIDLIMGWRHSPTGA